MSETPTGNKSKPPLTRTLQKFLTGIQLPPPPKRGRNRNMDYALFANALAWHASNVPNNPEFIEAYPSLKQLTQLMFCSSRTVRSIIEKLREHCILDTKRRGDGLSSKFTLYQKPQEHLRRKRISERKAVFPSEDGFRRENSDLREENCPVQSGKNAVQTGNNLSTSGVDLRDSKESSGVVLQGDSHKPKSTPTAALFKSEDQSQKRRPTAYGEEDVNSEEFSERYASYGDFLLETLELPFLHIETAMLCIRDEARRQNVSPRQAFQLIRNRIREDKAKGIPVRGVAYLTERRYLGEPSGGQSQ